MSRIESTPGPRPMGDDVAPSAPATARGGDVSLLPPPVPGVDDAASRLARLVIETSHALRGVARRADDDAERAARGAEDRSVAELHQKADAMRNWAWCEGGALAFSGALSISGAAIGAEDARPGHAASGLAASGKVVGELRPVLGSFGSATAAAHDANIEEARASVRRALRASDDGKKDLEALGNLIQKALTFARDAERTASDAQMAAIRRV